MAKDDTQRQVQFTRHFAESESAMTAFAFSLVPNRADADDIIQETLKVLWQKFDDYDPERPFLPWANRFVYRQVQIHRRSAAIRSKYLFSQETFDQLSADEPISLERDKAMSAALEQCLEKLSPKNRELIEQRYLAKGSIQNYAEKHGQTANAVYKTLQRVREILHHCISKRLKQEGFTI